jgi:uncharacterized protein
MFFVMKISKLCNLRCSYCYEYEELGLRHRMSLDGIDVFFAGVADWYQRTGWTSRLNFVLHGGEPLLLPSAYLRDFAGAARRHLAACGAPYGISLQTNLTRIDDERIALLEELGITLGISLDVFGGQRVDIAGRDSQERVLSNLQHLFDTDAVRRLAVGAISVLHRANVAYATNTFGFYQQLGLSYRILPMFSMTEPLAGMRELTLTHAQVLDALQAVARLQFTTSSAVVVYPLYNYMVAAVNHLAGVGGNAYDPRNGEWALIINTNGDVYNHAEAYSPEGRMGNVFSDSMTAILDGDARRRINELRLARARTCDACLYGQNCSRLPVVEALPSERSFDDEGNPACAIARPMIDFMIRHIQADPVARGLIAEHSASVPRDGVLAGAL